jgi:hypothetical protein
MYQGVARLSSLVLQRAEKEQTRRLARLLLCECCGAVAMIVMAVGRGEGGWCCVGDEAPPSTGQSCA